MAPTVNSPRKACWVPIDRMPAVPMAVARPILLVGPDENHVADILRDNDIGWHVRHGDVDGAERVLREIATADPGELAEKGRRAREVMAAMGRKPVACGRVCDVLERGL